MSPARLLPALSLALLSLPALAGAGDEAPAEASPTTREAGAAGDRHQADVQGSEGARLPTEHGDISLHGWAEGGLEVDVPTTGSEGSAGEDSGGEDSGSEDSGGEDSGVEDIVYGASLNLARLAVAYGDPHGFAARLQLDGAGGNVRLLDAVARLGGKADPHLQAGRFKVPLSAEVLVPATELVMPTRMLLVELAPGRAVGVTGALPWHPGGGQAHGGTHGSPHSGALTVGAFDPVGSVPQAGLGGLLVAAVDQGLARVGGAHLAVHVAGGAWVHPEDVDANLDVAGLLADAPAHDRWGDVSLAAEGGGWTLVVEGLAALRRAGVAEGAAGEGAAAEEGAAWDTGVGALAARRVGLADTGLELEPALAWDTLLAEDTVVHRPSVAVNLHQDDWHLVESLAYEAEIEAEGGQVVHIARATLQAGF